MEVRKLLQQKTVILDGAMGTTLQRLSLGAGEKPELMNLTSPEVIEGVHAAFVRAGAQLVYTNTFGANREKLGNDAGVAEVVSAAVSIAKRAAGVKAAVALDIGPIGRLTEPSGDLSFDEAYDIFKELVTEGEKAGADAVVFETFSSLTELRAGVLAAKENTDLPVLATMTFEESGRTFLGCSAAAFAITVSGIGVDAIGVNCSLGPKGLVPVVEEICKYTDLPVIVKPNAGLPDENGNYRLSAADFAAECELLCDAGASVLGGCCGTTPEFIAALIERKDRLTPKKRERTQKSVLCSATRVVECNRPLIVGERLNPTGKKTLKEAYLSGDEDYIISQALDQADAGASLLDLNVGVPGANECELMKSAVGIVSSVTDLPLSIDSSSPYALETGLRAFSGKALVNSVNGEEKSLSTVLPLVKKYGAAVIGLCLDENGVPKTADGRFEIAKRIVNAAKQYDIPCEDIVIDCLTLTVSAEQNQAAETLKALRRVKEELGVKTALGVSNVSFGLPDRDKISSAFLIAALEAGLDYAIINPNSAAMAYAFRAHAVLRGYDEGASEYITACTDKNMTALFNAQKSVTATAIEAKTDGFTSLIIKGSPLVSSETVRLLNEKTPLEVVNGYLIPALDEVGRLYESGRLFLPQLIKAAETAKLGFNEVKKAIEAAGGSGKSGGTIVLATVRGDVHDIGKNIVKVVLENYGYTVVDLGKSVEVSAVVDAVRRSGARLLGLSALMTTTVAAMEETITAVKAELPYCRIMVGGAVLTEEYAAKIGADYYASDANAAVRIAKEVLE